MRMDLQASDAATPNDVLGFHGPAVDIAGVGVPALVSLAIAIMRISAAAALMSPLLLAVWLMS